MLNERNNDMNRQSLFSKNQQKLIDLVNSMNKTPRLSASNNKHSPLYLNRFVNTFMHSFSILYILIIPKENFKI